jgi:acyl-CoA reductase-like NAD-dependent aldehyde dehydrogenase
MSAGGRLTVLEPGTGQPLEEVATVAVEELDERIARAEEGSRRWGALDPESRENLMLRVAGSIDAEAEELARTESRNVGKPIVESRAEIAAAAATFRYYAGAIGKHTGETFPSAGALHYTLRRPFGVVGAIVPWNVPLLLTTWKVAPALAAGNAIVVKPSDLTPLTALRLEAICLAAGIPEGVVQVLVGPGASLGRALVDHPGVRKLSFTGSTAVGREIAERGGRTMKRLTLELGGKAPNLIFADADLERAVPAAISACFANTGQDCCSRSRILVEQSVYAEMVDRLSVAVGDIAVGDPLDEATAMGPLISATHRSTVNGFVAEARADGARVIRGGSVLDGPGFFHAATLIDEVTPEMSVMQAEIFGPVAVVYPFRDEAHAIELANGTEYGLSASVWTADGDRAARVARQVETGVISINTNSSVHLNAPFGGVKASGIGRELGMAAMDAYTELKTVYHQTG